MAAVEQESLFLAFINEYLKHKTIPLKSELFKLHKIIGTDGYCKEILYDNNKIKFKCLDSLYLPFVLRMFNGEEVTDLDRVFYHNGLLAQFIEVPEIKLDIE